MIETKAVWAGITGGGSQAWRAEEWLRAELASLPVVYRRDAEGNAWVTLPGAGDRTVALGSSTVDSPAQKERNERYGLVVGAETLKALDRKFEGALPCSVSVLLKTAATQADSQDPAVPTVADLAQRTAYLELHTGDAAEAGDEGVQLGMVTDAQGTAAGLSPRLTMLGVEAVEELTGEPGKVGMSPGATARAMMQLGVPSAVMFVALPDSEPGTLADAQKVHLLQAAEAVGRWAKATVHLLAGDAVDLWALEHRMPHV